MSPETATGIQPGHTGRAFKIGNAFRATQPPLTVTVRLITASPPTADTCELTGFEMSQVEGMVKAE